MKIVLWITVMQGLDVDVDGVQPDIKAKLGVLKGRFGN